MMALDSRKLKPDAMFAAIRQRDQRFNGRFITGVLTTGIYCLPSCPARTPKFENIRFFKQPSQARKAGLRACLRCKPDDYYDNVDEDREIVLELCRRLFAKPAQYRDTAALVQASGIGSTKLNDLWRKHFHTTLSRSLRRARLQAAVNLLRASTEALDEIAAQTGYESLSTFHDQFKQGLGLSPGAFRSMQPEVAYDLALPQGFRMQDTLRYLQRDTADPLQAWQGHTLVRTFSLADAAAYAELRFHGDAIQVTPFCTADQLPQLHDQVLRLLGLTLDPTPFERFAVKQPEGAALVQDAAGLRLPQTPTPFEALVWGILGQQINLAFAYKLRQRLIQLADRRVAGRLVHPTAEQVVQLDEAALRGLQFSKSKVAYLHAAAQALVAGDLKLADTGMVSAEVLAQQLCAIRGIGTWTAQYVLMRGFGFADCIPKGDAGTRQGLALLRGQERVEHDEVDTFLAQYSPYGTFATAHLWRLAALAQLKKGGS